MRPRSWFACLLLLLAWAARGEPARPSFCIEWVRQSHEGYERLTLFSDRTLVWKTSRGGVSDVRIKKIPADELTFYCDYFAQAEFWALAGDFRTGLTGELATQSAVTLVRPDGSRKELRFDEFSALSPDASALRSSLEGLKSIFTNPLAPASRFTPETLPPGTLLKRFDGVWFRVLRVEKEKGIVELEGVRQPYSQFRKIEELRFQFSPPE